MQEIHPSWALHLTPNPPEQISLGGFGVYIWSQNDFSMHPQELQFWLWREKKSYRWTDVFQDANICKCGCKYLHPGLQTFASGTESIENITLNIWISMHKGAVSWGFSKSKQQAEGLRWLFLTNFSPILTLFSTAQMPTESHSDDSDASWRHLRKSPCKQ